MNAVRINLLPHREQKRVARQRQFVTLAITLAVLGLAVVALVHGVLSAQIENQNDRNRLLQSEIAKLDEQIKEIDRLREQIEAVLARKQVVETLQANRNEAVHLIDQLVRQLPDGIYLKSIKQEGTKVTAVGVAQSNARVSTLMRNIEASPWLSKPELVEIKAVALTAAAARDQSAVGRDLPSRINEFILNFYVKRALVIEPRAPGLSSGAGPKGAPASPAKAPSPPPPTKADGISTGNKT